MQREPTEVRLFMMYYLTGNFLQIFPHVEVGARDDDVDHRCVSAVIAALVILAITICSAVVGALVILAALVSSSSTSQPSGIATCTTPKKEMHSDSMTQKKAA